MRFILSIPFLATSCVLLEKSAHLQNLASVEDAEFKESQTQDNDGDGFVGAEDCNDSDPDAALLPECEELGLQFVLISPRDFYMGSTEESMGHNSNEIRHQVSLNRDFYIMDAELTVGQYAFYNRVELDPDNNDAIPVTQVSWYEAIRTANALSEKEELESCYTCDGPNQCITSESFFTIYDCPGYRLPTEAEWAYAARSDQNFGFWFRRSDNLLMGADFNPEAGLNQCQEALFNDGTALDDVGIYCGSDPAEIEEGKSRLPNGHLLFDVHGNVAEWVQDSFYQMTEEDAYDPVVDTNFSTKRMVRGGSFNNRPKDLRSYARRQENADQGYNDIGFRLVRTASWPDI